MGGGRSRGRGRGGSTRRSRRSRRRSSSSGCGSRLSYLYGGRGRDSSQTKERRVAREQRTSQEHNRNNTFQSVTPAGRHFPNHGPKLLRLPISFPGVGPTS